MYQVAISVKVVDLESPFRPLLNGFNVQRLSQACYELLEVDRAIAILICWHEEGEISRHEEGEISIRRDTGRHRSILVALP